MPRARIDNGTDSNDLAGAPYFRGRKIYKGVAATLSVEDSGALCLFDKAAGFTYTLPAPVVGAWFEFYVDTTITSVAAKVITDAATTFIKGIFTQSTDGTYTTALQAANGTTIRAWSGNGSTTGGINGDGFKLTAISSTVWEITQGFGTATGTEATPFATS